MQANRWDEILVAEHEMIERAMDILKQELEKMPGASGDIFAIKRSMDFLLEFGDRIHNRKEEDDEKESWTQCASQTVNKPCTQEVSMGF